MEKLCLESIGDSLDTYVMDFSPSTPPPPGDQIIDNVGGGGVIVDDVGGGGPIDDNI